MPKRQIRKYFMNDDSYITIEQVTSFSNELAVAIRSLVNQLDNSFQPLSDNDIQSIVSSKNTYLYIVKSNNDKIIGMATLIVYRIPYCWKGIIEDVVVDENYRGRGIGKRLLQYVIEEAKKRKVKSLNLTSQPSRIAANRLYESLGFEKRNTNVYRLYL